MNTIIVIEPIYEYGICVNIPYNEIDDKKENYLKNKDSQLEIEFNDTKEDNYSKLTKKELIEEINKLKESNAIYINKLKELEEKCNTVISEYKKDIDFCENQLKDKYNAIGYLNNKLNKIADLF